MRQLKEYKDIDKKEEILLTRCKNAIKNIDHSAQIILYGSRARSESSIDSDYDLLVIVDGDASLEMEDIFRRQLFPIELDTGFVFTVILYGKKEWNTSLFSAMPFYKNVQEDGIVL